MRRLEGDAHSLVAVERVLARSRTGGVLIPAFGVNNGNGMAAMVEACGGGWTCQERGGIAIPARPNFRLSWAV
jgi:hypothetical protein